MKGQAPLWASRLLQEVCEGAGVSTPALLWIKHRDREGSSGKANQLRGLTVHAGLSYRDQRFVLLHEAAHWIRFATDPHASHDWRFWDIAFDLYKSHRMGQYALEREEGYRQEALAAAARAGVTTFKEAARRAQRNTGWRWDESQQKFVRQQARKLRRSAPPSAK